MTLNHQQKFTVIQYRYLVEAGPRPCATQHHETNTNDDNDILLCTTSPVRGSPGSKKTIALRNENSELSSWMSCSGWTSSSRMRLTRRGTSSVAEPSRSASCAARKWRGTMASLPSNSVSRSAIERLATPSNRCSPAWARNSATYRITSAHCKLKRLWNYEEPRR